jgi:hypothetical protein
MSYGFECDDTCILFNIKTNVIITMTMHVMHRKELELLRKTVANYVQPQAEDDHEKDSVERLSTGW